MIRWEKIEGGVRKYHDWGWVDIYAPFEECFTKDELIQVTIELDTLQKMGCVSVGSQPLLQKCKDKLKELI